jgi:hypothetical protein
VQDGDGPWTSVDAAAGTYTFDVQSGRYAIAFACATSGTVALNLLAATVGDGTEVEIACGQQPNVEPLVDIGGTVSGLTGTEEARVHVGGETASPTSAAPDWTLGVPVGKRDVFARKVASGLTSTHVIRRNDVEIAAGLTLDFDFGAEGFVPEMHTVTVNGASAGDAPTVLAQFVARPGGTTFSLGQLTEDLTYRAIPANQMRSEDFHDVIAGVYDTASSTYRNVQRTFIAARDFTATLRTLPPVPTLTASARTPHLRPEITIPVDSDADWIAVKFTQLDAVPSFSRSWSVSATSGWIAAAAVSSLSIPDLSAVVGYDPKWGLVDGSELSWHEAEWTSSQGVTPLLDANATAAELDGRETNFAQRFGTTTL